MAQENANGEVLWALGERLGTVKDVVDGSGSVINHIIYDAFGNITSQTNSSVDFRFTYTAREFDKETNQYFYRSRYYEPSVGRFISEDTIGFQAGDPNLYRYVLNSPTNFNDPWGLRALTSSEQKVMNQIEKTAAIAKEQSGNELFARKLLALKKHLLNEIGKISQGSQDPINIQAILWALKTWTYGPDLYKTASLLIPDFGLNVRRYEYQQGVTNTCNRFVGDAYALGADLGYSYNPKENGYPTALTLPGHLLRRTPYPVSAQNLASETFRDPRLPLVYNPQIGDIISFDETEGQAHTGLYLGFGLYISARAEPAPGGQIQDAVQISEIPNIAEGGNIEGITYRRFTPFVQNIKNSIDGYQFIGPYGNY